MARMGREQSFEEKLKAYSKAAAGALMVAPAALSMTALMPGRADAAVNYSGPKNIVLNPGNTYYSIDIDNDGDPDFAIRFASTTGSTNNGNGSNMTSMQRQGRFFFILSSPAASHLGGPPIYFNAPFMVDEAKKLNSSYQLGSTAINWYNSTTGGNPYLGKLAGYATIKYYNHTSGSLMTISASTAKKYGQFLGTQGYIGVRFDTGTVAPCIHYGWIGFTAAPDASQGIITDWAYEDQCDTPIHIQQQTPTTVPTLTQWGAFALVALLAAGGAVTLRRREEKV